MYKQGTPMCVAELKKPEQYSYIVASGKSVQACLSHFHCPAPHVQQIGHCSHRQTSRAPFGRTDTLGAAPHSWGRRHGRTTGSPSTGHRSRSRTPISRPPATAIGVAKDWHMLQGPLQLLRDVAANNVSRTAARFSAAQSTGVPPVLGAQQPEKWRGRALHS
jgi:hypothetical protein